MTKEELAVQLVDYAERKLEMIIEREGTANGMRLEPWYLAQLLSEEIRSYKASWVLGI